MFREWGTYANIGATIEEKKEYQYIHVGLEKNENNKTEPISGEALKTDFCNPEPISRFYPSFVPLPELQR